MLEAGGDILQDSEPGLKEQGLAGQPVLLLGCFSCYGRILEGLGLRPAKLGWILSQGPFSELRRASEGILE